VRIYAISITLNYKHIPRTEVAYINCFINSLNIYADKISVFNFNILSIYLFISKRPYYNSGLSLNKSIDLTSIDL